MVSFFIATRRLFNAIVHTLKDDEGRSILIFVGTLLLSGTIFYTTVEGFNWLDSLYFCFMTLTTIGYGDFVPLTAIGKIFTMVYSALGLGFMALLITHIATAYSTSKKIQTQHRENIKQRIKGRR